MVDEAVRLVQPVRLRPVVARLEGQHVAAAAPAFLGARVQKRACRAASAKRIVHEQIGDPALRRRPVESRLDPEADRAGNIAVRLGDVDPAVGVLEVREEDLALRLRVLCHGRPRQIRHQLQYAVGVARLSLADGHGIERYIRRKVGRKPRLGQNREARRFVIRQSVVIVG